MTAKAPRGSFETMSFSESQVAQHANGKPATDASPIRVVRQFLDGLAAGDLDGATDLLAPDVEYINVSTPTIRGRERVRRVLGAAMGLPGAGFEVYFHAISSDQGAVLTERTDVLTWGAFRMQFWVCGRFDVRDGEIVLWKDYFDWANFTIAMLRGLVGVVIPAIRAKPPA
jgi:limonene-1,2-epoxide hydrolase